MNKYEDFLISMEPPSLVALAEGARKQAVVCSGTTRAELLNLACEIEARMQHLAHERSTHEPEQDWLT